MSRVKSDEERHAKAFFLRIGGSFEGAFKEQCCCFILGGAFRGFTD